MPDINMQVFEEAQRNQLVTEIDIQTQVALDDYQVQLSDIANPTQSQDNIVIDRHGEFLPHWNESLDFDTWIKMSMEVAGKKLLMIHGNAGLSSESNGNDTFLQYAENKTLSYAGDFEINLDYFIIETKSKVTNIDTDSDALYVGMSDTGTPSNDCIWIDYYRGNTARFFTKNNGVSTSTSISKTWILDNWYIFKIIKLNNVAEGYIDGTKVFSDLTSNIPTGNAMGIMWDVDGDFTGELNHAFVRKYTATEPTVKISTPKNISTALKSLGRAG